MVCPDQLNFSPVQNETALTLVSMLDQTQTGLDQTTATLAYIHEGSYLTKHTKGENNSCHKQ